MDGDQLLPPEVQGALNPIQAAQQASMINGSGLSALDQQAPQAPVSPSSLPPPSAPYAGNTGLSKLNAYIDNRYSPSQGQALSDHLDAANQGLAAIMQNPQTDERGKWLAVAAALGKPTKSGQFLEAASNGLDAYNQISNADFQRQQQYKLMLAQMIQQRAQSQFDLFQSAQQQALEKDAALGFTAMKPGNGITPIVKVVNGQLVKFDPMTQETTTLAGGQAAQYGKYYDKFLDVAKTLNFTSADEMTNYAAQKASEAMMQAGAFQVNAPPASTGSPEISRLTQMQNDAVARNDFTTANQLAARISALNAAPPAAAVPGGAPIAATPLNVPVVPSTTPRPGMPVPGSTNDRVAILNQELADTQARIATATRQIPTTTDDELRAQLQATIDRSTQDIPALQAEIAKVSKGVVGPPIAAAPTLPVAQAPQIMRKMEFPKDASGNPIAVQQMGVPGAPVVASPIVGVDGRPVNADSGLSDAAIQTLATRVAHGDTTALQNIGRGAQGAADLRKIQNAATNIMTAEGKSPDDIIAAGINLGGEKAGARTLGTRSANLTVAANELNNFSDLALAASAAVPRTQFTPYNQLANLVQNKTGSVEQSRLFAATQSVINAFAQVAGRGTPSDALRKHAEEMLNGAQTPEQYAATIGQMKAEAKAANQSTVEGQTAIRDRITGKSSSGGPAVPLDPTKQALYDKYGIK